MSEVIFRLAMAHDRRWTGPEAMIRPGRPMNNGYHPAEWPEGTEHEPEGA
ncbi:MAG: hypothetical protein LPK79_11905 [Bacteroidota bacterium]|nr:hypothetical protein [Bacteroidota bacterium]